MPYISTIAPQTRGIGFAVLAGSLFGTAGPFTRSVTGVTPVGIAAGRLLLGFLFMAGLILLQGRKQEFIRSLRHSPFWLILGMLSCFHFVFFVLAIQKTFIANALILINTAPIFVLLLAPCVLRESVTKSDLAGVLVTVIGASCVVGVDRILLTPEHVAGDLFALGSAVCYALYIVIARKLRHDYSSPVIMVWFFGPGAMFLMVGGILTGDKFVLAPSWQGLVFLTLLGVFPTGIGHFSYNVSLKYIAAAKASTIILLEPVTGTLFAWLFLGEIPPLLSWIGILVALSGISIATLSHLRGKEQE